MGMEICVHLDVCKYPEILWWRFDGDACVENVNMDVRLFSSQSFQFTVFLRSKKMFCFTALGLSLDPVNNIWQIGKKHLFSCFFVLRFFYILYLWHACLVFVALSNIIWQVGKTGLRMQKISPGVQSHCVTFCVIFCRIVSYYVTFFFIFCHMLSYFVTFCHIWCFFKSNPGVP